MSYTCIECGDAADGSEILLAGRACDAVEFERASVECVCEELGVDLAEFEVLEVDELGGRDA